MPCVHFWQLYQLCNEHDLKLGGSDLIRVVCRQCGEQEVCPSVLVDMDGPDEDQHWASSDAAESTATDAATRSRSRPARRRLYPTPRLDCGDILDAAGGNYGKMAPDPITRSNRTEEWSASGTLDGPNFLPAKMKRRIGFAGTLLFRNRSDIYQVPTAVIAKENDWIIVDMRRDWNASFHPRIKPMRQTSKTMRP